MPNVQSIIRSQLGTLYGGDSKAPHMQSLRKLRWEGLTFNIFVNIVSLLFILIIFQGDTQVMSEATKTKSDHSLLLKDTSGLMEQKSVRATFRISPEFIEALSILSGRLGLKQKSLFDYLLEDSDALIAIARSKPQENSRKKERIQKTFVISKKSLSSLEKLLDEVEASRDDLVEYAIQRLLPILLKERSQQKKREAVLSQIAQHFEHSVELMRRIEKSVGKDDPLCEYFAAVIQAFRDAFNKMENLVQQGKRISKLRLEKFELQYQRNESGPS